MMARTKRIYILMIEVNKLFFFFFVAVFSKRNRKHVLRVPIESYRKSCGNTRLRLPCETEVPCSFFSVRDERNLCSQPHDILSCMRELRQHLSRETPLPDLETKRHFLLFRGNSLRQLRTKKTSVCRQLLLLRRMCRLKLHPKSL